MKLLGAVLLVTALRCAWAWMPDRRRGTTGEVLVIELCFIAALLGAIAALSPL